MTESLQSIKDLYQAFARGDVPAVLEQFDPAIDWREAENSPYADGNPYIGPVAVAQDVFQRMAGEIDGLSVVPDRFAGGGDCVVVEGRYQGTVKSTGKTLNAQFAHVFELRNGLIIRFQQFTDTLHWADTGAAD